MKKIFAILIVLYSFNVVASEIEWNTTHITSQSYFSFLEETFEADAYLNPIVKPANYTQSELATSSLPSFRNAVIKFFSNEKIPSHFLHICTPDKLSKKPGNSINNYNLPFNSYLYFKLFTGAEYFSNSTRNTNYSYVYYGTKLFADINNTLYIDSFWWTGHFDGDEEFFRTSPIMDSWSQHPNEDEQISVDNASGKIVYKKKYVYLSIGRGKHIIGNNIGGSIILNDACNDYGYFSGKLDFKKFSISMMHGTLVPDSTNVDHIGEPIYKDYNDKYLVIKKLDWKPSIHLHFYAGEEVVYGGRSIDPSYLLPQTFLRATEHNLQDRDNVLVFGGVNFIPFSQNTFYANFILDELSRSKIFTDWWGNKYAIQVGNSYLFNSKNNSRITFEFTAVRPWLYTHKILHNKYSHDGIGLGFPDGSNLIQFSSELNYKLLSCLTGNIHSSYTKQGSLGNDFSINYETRPDDTADWLEGDKTEKIEVRTIFKWQPLTHHRLLFGHSAYKIDENDIEHQLNISYQASY